MEPLKEEDEQQLGQSVKLTALRRILSRLPPCTLFTLGFSSSFALLFYTLTHLIYGPLPCVNLPTPPTPIDYELTIETSPARVLATEIPRISIPTTGSPYASIQNCHYYPIIFDRLSNPIFLFNCSYKEGSTLISSIWAVFGQTSLKPAWVFNEKQMVDVRNFFIGKYRSWMSDNSNKAITLPSLLISNHFTIDKLNDSSTPIPIAPLTVSFIHLRKTSSERNGYRWFTLGELLINEHSLVSLFNTIYKQYLSAYNKY